MKLIAAALLAGIVLSNTKCEGWPPSVPTPTPTPSATPTSTVTPSPSPSASPSFECVLPPSDGTCVDNPKSAPVFRDAVYHAQDLAAIAGYVRDDGTVTDELEYTAAVAKNLRKAGFCATNGLADEVWVKNANGFSEHYDIVRSDRMIMNLYAAKCTPAKF